MAGALRPGNSPGTLTVLGPVAFASGSRLGLDIDGTGTGTGATAAAPTSIALRLGAVEGGLDVQRGAGEDRELGVGLAHEPQIGAGGERCA